jgi:hypothetical protein
MSSPTSRLVIFSLREGVLQQNTVNYHADICLESQMYYFLDTAVFITASAWASGLGAGVDRDIVD